MSDKGFSQRNKMCLLETITATLRMEHCLQFSDHAKCTGFFLCLHNSNLKNKTYQGFLKLLIYTRHPL